MKATKRDAKQKKAETRKCVICQNRFDIKNLCGWGACKSCQKKSIEMRRILRRFKWNSSHDYKNHDLRMEMYEQAYANNEPIPYGEYNP